MEKDFWLARWEREETGFHQEEFNPYLCQYWNELNLASNGVVFVPLCGKSRDMLWLREQGHHVLGVELSPVAAHAFFRENCFTQQQISLFQSDNGKFACVEAGEIRILCGDFHNLGKEDLEQVIAVYDRASLVALPPTMRKSYVAHLANILPPATQTLLITFEYPQQEMSGPPFSVSSEEVTALYQDYAEVRLLSQVDVLSQNPRFQQRGLSKLREKIYLLIFR